MVMITILFRYDDELNEVKPQFSYHYKKMDSIIKMDILNDAIFYLEAERNKLHDKMYKEKQLDHYDKKIKIISKGKK